MLAKHYHHLIPNILSVKFPHRSYDLRFFLYNNIFPYRTIWLYFRVKLMLWDLYDNIQLYDNYCHRPPQVPAKYSYCYKCFPVLYPDICFSSNHRKYHKIPVLYHKLVY